MNKAFAHLIKFNPLLSVCLSVCGQSFSLNIFDPMNRKLIKSLIFSEKAFKGDLPSINS